MSNAPNRQELEFLRSIDTPTACNLIEIVAPERRGSGYTVKHLHCPFPELPRGHQGRDARLTVSSFRGPGVSPRARNL
ncbi:MAG: hypothetical protein E6G88_08035 [Alphaproteobacteria bacterium]|nr:MAG: hypothetical protein E6G88_08035 [Alphaproteobacteria bacterium]